MKINWKDVFNNIVNGIKFGLLTFMMTAGFFISYAFVAYSIMSLSPTDTALWICFGLAIISEILYIKWVTVIN